MNSCEHKEIIKKQINPEGVYAEWYECKSCGAKFDKPTQI